MDESPSPSRMGGTVVPGNQGDIALASIQHRAAAAGVRYELRDPMAEVTYRSTSVNDITAKADKLGSERFTEIDAAEQRTTMRKIDGQWQRGPQRPAPAAHATEAVNERDEVPDRFRGSEAAPHQLGQQPATERTEARDMPARLEAQADQAALARRLNIELAERYVIKRGPTWWGGANQTEYRFRGNLQRIAFTEARYRLATDNNSPSVARSMVDVAQSRDWRSLRVSGHEEFRRAVWFEASLRGLRTIGYEPIPSDIAWLRSEREGRQLNRIEPSAAAAPAAPGAKASARGSGSRKTVLAAIEAVLVAQRVPEQRREAIMTAAADNLAKRLAAGEVHKVKVYDKTAPQQQPVVRPMPEQQRARDRTAHVR